MKAPTPSVRPFHTALPRASFGLPTQPLRFSIEDPERQARYAAVFAIVAGAFVPLNFMAVRMAESLVHPRVLSTTGGSMPGSMRTTFLISLIEPDSGYGAVVPGVVVLGVGVGLFYASITTAALK